VLVVPRSSSLHPSVFAADETKQPVYNVLGEGESNLRTITCLNHGCCVGLSMLSTTTTTTTSSGQPG